MKGKFVAIVVLRGGGWSDGQMVSSFSRMVIRGIDLYQNFADGVLADHGYTKEDFRKFFLEADKEAGN